jgi:hypothetical protein
MKDTLAQGIPLAIVLSAAVATVALRAAARRQQPRWLPCPEPEPVTATAGEGRPWPAVTAGTHDGAGYEMPGPPGSQGRPPGTVEQMHYVFHELHPDGRNALCAVCDGQYRSARRQHGR